MPLGAGFSLASASASLGAVTCALSGDGRVKCFGKTVFNESSSTPFWGVLGACWARASYNSSAVACASDTSLAPNTSYGYFSTDMGDNLPAVALGGLKATQLVTGGQFTCIIANDQSLRCWGANDHGQLGNGTETSVGALPSDMGANLVATIAATGGVGPTMVAAGSAHACAVLSNNTLKCWGAASENATGLGTSTDTGIKTPAQLPLVYDGR